MTKNRDFRDRIVIFRLIYCVRMRHCTRIDRTRTLVPVGTSGNNCLKSKWLKIVKLNYVISMVFRNGKMLRSHVDTAYAAISTVKVAAFTAINRIRVKVNKKKSEISGFGLIK